MRVLAAPDKFRGTATAVEVAAAIGRAARDLGCECHELPLADGGEGTLDVLGGPNRTSVVSGPLGDPVEAAWRLHRRTAVIESARASGLALVDGAAGNDPIAATTRGTGELIAQAVELGATRVLVTLGGSATTDGGLGALEALHPTGRLKGIELVVAADVNTLFVDAAEVFAPQKGASPAQVELLRRRLERLTQVYEADFGVDVRPIVGGGAAGGLAGGLAAVGAEIVPGFELVAEELGLDVLVEHSDLVITGEGFLDQQSFEGKVIGGLLELAAGTEVVAIVGEAYDGAENRVETVSLTALAGSERAHSDTAALIEQAARELIAARL